MKNDMSRRSFIKKTVVTTAMTGFSALPFIELNDASTVNKKEINNKKVLLKNVRMETGFQYDGEEVIGTNTELFCIEIENGNISNILPNRLDAQAEDMKGLLMLPAFRDMHIHLDKTYYGETWRAVRRRENGVKGMIALEQNILPYLLKKSTYKAEKMIELLQSKGTTFARSHVNIEPTSQLTSLLNLQKALENKKDNFGAELVVFPQHGVFYTNSAPYLEEAAKMDIDFIGGLDPYTIDGAIEKSMDFTVRLALDYQKGIDIHLHETGDSGLKTIEYLIDRVNENPSLKGKTFLSHCFVLAKLEPRKQEEIAEKLSDAQIGVVTTIPFGGLIMPIPLLYKHGVNVMTGNDSIIDHWNTFGSGSVLEKAKLMAQLYGYSSEFGLSRCLRIATGDILPLNDHGNRQWPQVGSKADLVFFRATCSAEVVARQSEVEALMYRGGWVL